MYVVFCKEIVSEPEENVRHKKPAHAWIASVAYVGDLISIGLRSLKCGNTKYEKYRVVSKDKALFCFIESASLKKFEFLRQFSKT